LPTTPQQTMTSTNDWLPRLMRLLLGFGAGALPGAVFLAIATGLLPGALPMPVLGLAFGLYLISLPVAAWLVRPRGRTLVSIGYLIGFAVSTVVLFVLLMIDASLAASAS